MAGCATLGFFAWKWLVRLLMLWFLVYIMSGILGFGPLGYNHGTMRRLSELRTKAMMKDIQIALSHFKTEYERYPEPASKDVILRSEGKMIQSLLGQEKESNPHDIRFIDLPLAKNGKYGLTGMNGDSREIPADIKLTDPWGEMFYLLIDDSSNENHQLPNPECRPDALSKGPGKHPAPEFLNAPMLIFSSGPDRDPKTWNDNICSWR